MSTEIVSAEILAEIANYQRTYSTMRFDADGKGMALAQQRTHRIDCPNFIARPRVLGIALAAEIAPCCAVDADPAVIMLDERAHRLEWWLEIREGEDQAQIAHREKWTRRALADYLEARDALTTVQPITLF